MKKIIVLALAVAVSSVFAAAPQNDPAAYKSGWDKATVDYKMAKAECNARTGNAKTVCVKEAEAMRAHAEVDVVATYKNTERAMNKAHKAAINADHDLAKAKCGDQSGNDKKTCLSVAKSARMAALADLKSSAKMAGTQTTGMGADTTSTGSKSAGARHAIADTVITTKIKADLVKDPDLKAMDVHVETVQGVVMLSGFVPSEAERAKAVELARSVEGVTDVKSSLKVK